MRVRLCVACVLVRARARGDILHPPPPTTVLQKFEHLFEANSTEKGNSFYLQSKVYRAHESLLAELGTNKDGTLIPGEEGKDAVQEGLPEDQVSEGEQEAKKEGAEEGTNEETQENVEDDPKEDTKDDLENEEDDEYAEEDMEEDLVEEEEEDTAPKQGTLEGESEEQNPRVGRKRL